MSMFLSQGENKINRRELACLPLTNLPSFPYSKLSTYSSFRNDQLFCEHTGLEKFLPSEYCVTQTVSSPVPAVQVSMLSVPFPPAYKRMHCAICHLTCNKIKLVFILNGRMPPSFSGCVFSKTWKLKLEVLVSTSSFLILLKKQTPHSKESALIKATTDHQIS